MWLGWATAGNASANDMALCALERKLNGPDQTFLKKWPGQDRRVRYSYSFNPLSLCKSDRNQVHGTYITPWGGCVRQSRESKDEELDEKTLLHLLKTHPWQQFPTLLCPFF